MSINLMSAIFRTEFRDLQDEAGNTTKASTAKFVCLALADHANDEGEGAYPSINKIAYKTALSRRAVINTLGALKHNGILTVQGLSKWDTVNYTVAMKCFSRDDFPEVVANLLTPPQCTRCTPPVHPVHPPSAPGAPESSFNHPLTIHGNSNSKPADDIDFGEESAKPAGEKPAKPDLVDGILALSQSPGIKREARINSILSYLGQTFGRNTETKEWQAFAKMVDSEHQSKGWSVEVFVLWLKSQKGYDPTYWPVKKMMEFYPSAFAQAQSAELHTEVSL